MKCIRHNYFRFILLVTLTIFPCISQASPSDTSALTEERHYWGNMGFGGASVPRGFGEDNGGLSLGATLSYRKGSHLFSLRGITNVEVKMDLWGDSGPGENVWDIGLLYGRVTKVEYGMASISAGVGLVGASKYGNSLPLHFGMPVEAQLFWTPSPTIGFGICGFADLNSYKSFYGILFCVQLCREL